MDILRMSFLKLLRYFAQKTLPKTPLLRQSHVFSLFLFHGHNIFHRPPWRTMRVSERICATTTLKSINFWFSRRRVHFETGCAATQMFGWIYFCDWRFYDNATTTQSINKLKWLLCIIIINWVTSRNHSIVFTSFNLSVTTTTLLYFFVSKSINKRIPWNYSTTFHSIVQPKLNNE